MTDTFTFSGRISATTPDGRGAIVSLDSRVDGKTLAVISPETNGRVTVMNGKGRLEKGTMVTGVAEHGPEALRAISISEMK